MATFIGRNRKARTTYGFDEIALVPGSVTINPNEVDISFSIPRKDAAPIKLAIPVLASAMDGVVDVRFAIEMGKLGGLAVLNLEGVQTRYKNPEEVLLKVLEADKENVTALLQKIYQEPVQEDLIAARIKEIKDSGVIAAVSSIPQKAERFGKIAQQAGVDVFVVQSTVSTVRHISTEYKSLDLKSFCAEMTCPVIVGNTVGYDVTLEIMECGVAGVFNWCWAGGGMYLPRSSGTRRSTGHRHGRLRSRPGSFLQENRALRPHHYRRRHEQRGRRLQSAGLRFRRRHDRKRICEGCGSAGQRLPLGNGDTARQPPAWYSNPCRYNRRSSADSVRAGRRR